MGTSGACRPSAGDPDAATASPSASGDPGPLSGGEALAGPRAVLVSPERPRPGRPLRVLAAFASDAARVRLSLRGPSGRLDPSATKRGGGPPFWLAAEFAAAPAGGLSVLIEEGRNAVELAGPFGPDVTAGWTWAAESFYAAWIEALFAVADERSSWSALHEVTRDRSLNLLHDHLGLGEDEPSGPNALEMTPDCADNPYFLRAYFAWKLGLPFGFRETSWGTLESPPVAGRLILADQRRPAAASGSRAVSAAGPGAPRAASGASVEAMRRFLGTIKNVVHAGNGRTALRAEGTDYYPLALTRRALEPGTVFADPYGHTYTIVRWVAQTRKSPGLLLGADAQPDGTIGVKRFWKGNFLFATEGVVGEPGFKAFRPIVLDAAGRPRPLTNREIAESADYGDLSLEQEGMAGDAFYARMERLINPDPLDAEAALEELTRALHEQLLVRVGSVRNGEDYMRAHPGTVIPMPSGRAVFQTLGLWEDYSTPNRDLRLLIAIDTVLEFPDKVARNPGAYDLGRWKTPEEARRGLAALSAKRAAELSITYIASDGSARVLTLEDIFRRQEAFEMAYNPNDSVEIRWGAPEGSAERATARRRAPASQLAKMEALRPFFKR
ncbi:MAG TPA: hypothetical protein ENO03_00750 [Candidatus Aminicenantes bacterium]|nr:hypothetical protein [Candidatus Aminicenantes bacterium]